MSHHDAAPASAGGAGGMTAPNLEARIEHLEHQVERLSKALTLMGIAADFASAPSTPDTYGSAPADLRQIELRPA